MNQFKIWRTKKLKIKFNKKLQNKLVFRQGKNLKCLLIQRLGHYNEKKRK